MKIKKRYSGIIDYFKTNMPIAESELHFDSTFQLLVAVILSAQCTDKRVNIVTPSLFEAYPTAKDMAQASIDNIFSYIKSISYPNNKAKNLHGMAVKLLTDFGGEVPADIEQMMTLPGVGRKTANVVGAIVWNKAVMPVDTHIFRVSARIGLSQRATTPRATELQLEKNIPPQLLPIAHHWLLLHGRYICTAKKPKCEQCGIKQYCKTYEKNRKNECCPTA